MKHRASKSSFFSSFQKLIGIAANTGSKSPPPDEVLQILNEKKVLSRRDLLKGFGSTAALFALSGFPQFPKKNTSTRIAIIGGGIAGLNAAYRLKKAGITANIYEADNRIGGRILTYQDSVARGMTAEFGGEFIDSDHLDMLSLVSELGLKLGDRHSESEKSLNPRVYFFGGLKYSEKEVIESIRPYIARIKSDVAGLPRHLDLELPGKITALDNMSLAEYFEKIGISGWLKNLLETAYITEFGLETSDQSALNFLTMFSPEITEGFKIFGSSDERYIIKGGNSKLTEALSFQLKDNISLSHTLDSIKSKGKGFVLTFFSEGSTKDIEADIVLLAIPFSVLRGVDIKVDLPDWKKHAINELGYGTNSKVLVGFTNPIWKKQGFLGEVFSDEDFQLVWDNSQLQSGDGVGLTSFTGGSKGIDAGKGTLDFQCNKVMTGAEKVFPGLSSQSNGNKGRYHWTNNTLAKGSYSVYKPGQWTKIRGAESKPIGNLFFAGEHCSLEFQGFMNGAAQSGRTAAEKILKLLD